MNRCKWCNEKNKLYVEYHDNAWGIPNFDDKYLFEMLILESFQAGLSWECVLNKREAFRIAFDNFNIEKIIKYDDNVTFQRCGVENGSGEFEYPDLDTLYHSVVIDGICLEKDWNNIETIVIDSSFDLAFPEEIEKLKEKQSC